MEERISMSTKDLKRAEVSPVAQERRIKQREAAGILGISPRHFRRVLRSFLAEGPKGVVSKKGGAKGNHRLSQDKEDRLLSSSGTQTIAILALLWLKNI